MGKFNDISGHRFGRLVAIKPDRSAKQLAWECRCDCGASKTIPTSSLNRGDTKSCGCLRREVTSLRNTLTKTSHGMTDTGTYQSWSQMLQRCNNPKSPTWDRYGGRGITVCERWHTFQNFLDDMGPRTAEQTIDRVKTDGNYEKNNCRWATHKVQQNNRSNNRPLTAFGKTMNLKQWARQFGIGRTTLSCRIKRGWSLETALATTTAHGWLPLHKRVASKSG